MLIASIIKRKSAEYVNARIFYYVFLFVLLGGSTLNALNKAVNAVKENWQIALVDVFALVFVIISLVLHNIVLAIVLIVLAVIATVLGIRAKKNLALQEIQKQQMEAAKQNVTMFIISKKKVKLAEAGLPSSAMESVSKFDRLRKFPVVKAKVGPQVMTFMCDPSIFDSIPEKKEVKATVSGLYITYVKSLHGNKNVVKEAPKKSFWKAALEKAQEKAGAKQIK